MSPNVLRELPRGGYLVTTPHERIQFGAPPETIKDTMPDASGVPEIFVLPRQMFNWSKGINVADMEFPIYFHFFIRKQRPLICGTMAQARSLSTALQEAVFGPKGFTIHSDMIEIGDDTFVPDISQELAFFRRGLELKDMFRFRPFKDGRLRVGSATITITDGDNYLVEADGMEPVEVPGYIDYTARFDGGSTLPEPFIPPRFGVTCLGPSHGFDPADNTSGFIIWLNHNGIMIDPPVNSTEWLLKANVNPKYIDSIILTHCHADHDAGTFQKILEEGRVTIYTTKTIMGSFLRKYAAFSEESEEYLQRFFSFQPIYIGRTTQIHGGEFDVFYSLHSIPTMAFKLSFQGKTFVYSSDHQGDVEVQRQLLSEGLIDQRRFDQLHSFPWQSDVIYHESGIAPLHTSLTFLASLPADVQQRIVVYHISEKDFAKVENQGLTRATFGIENTLYFETSEPPYEDAYRMLDVLKRLDFFESMPVKKVQEFLTVVERRHFSRGEKVIEEGTLGDAFYIIESGNASVVNAELETQKKLGAYDYFGEVALLTNRRRTADIIAETELDTIVLPKDKFINFISGTEFEKLLLRVIERRDEHIWNLLVATPAFSRLTDYQKMWLEGTLQMQDFDDGTVLVEQGDALPGVYLIAEGDVAVSKDRRERSSLGRAETVGMLPVLFRGEPARFTFTCRGPVLALFISKSDAIEFMERNPGASMRVETLYA